MRGSPLLLGCKPEQQGTVVNTVGVCNTVASGFAPTHGKGKVKTAAYEIKKAALYRALSMNGACRTEGCAGQ